VVPVEQRDWYTTPEAAVRLGVNRQTLDGWRKDNRVLVDTDQRGSQSLHRFPKSFIDRLPPKRRPPILQPVTPQVGSLADLQAALEETARQAARVAVSEYSEQMATRDLDRAREVIRRLIAAIMASVNDPSLTVDMVIEAAQAEEHRRANDR